MNTLKQDISQIIGDIKGILGQHLAHISTDSAGSHKPADYSNAQLSSALKLEVSQEGSEELAKAHLQIAELNKALSDQTLLLSESQKFIEQIESKNVDLTQENNLLLMQLKILKEDLKNASSERANQLKIEAALENRLSRIQDLLPDTYEHGLLEIMDLVNDGTGQTLTCRYTDFKLKNLSDSEFFFQLASSSEGVGIWIDPEPGLSQFFYPKRVGQDKQRNLFFSYTVQQWSRVLSAISGCLHYFESRPKYFVIPKSFDADKWLELISTLRDQVSSLPTMPRFDAVGLKREQHNQDYEYIWFEISNLTYEDFSCPKFEIRFSASLVQADGFSRFPKIEIPLVEGIHKPFASWYAESTDELGDKFEIRFALDNHSFDLKVWNQLSAQDKSVLTLLILYFPQILGRLSLNVELAGRPWSDWMLLANQTSGVFKAFLTGKSQFAAALKDEGVKGEGDPKSAPVKSFAVRPKKRG
jgi:hypothetical protein